MSIGDADFRPYNHQELELIKEARLILLISFLSHNNVMRIGPNAGHWCATTENFNPIYQNFKVDDDNLAIFDGSIIKMTSGGYQLSTYKSYRPNHVPTPIDFALDDALFNELLLLRSKKPRVFRRTINAIELFSESYYNSTSLSNNARVLCQMSAFEMLLEVVPKNQTGS